MDSNAIASANKVKVSAKTLLSASGFLVAGILWGMQIANKIDYQGGNFISPFVYIMGSIYLAIFGTISFAYFNRSPADKNSFKDFFWSHDKEIFYSLIYWFCIFIVLNIFSYHLFLLGKIIYILPRIFSIADNLTGQAININPILFGDLWIGFLILSFASLFFYSKIFQGRYKIKNALWIIPAIFLIPIFSNLFSDNRTKIIICFGLLCFALGIIISACVKKNENTLF